MGNKKNSIGKLNKSILLNVSSYIVDTFKIKRIMAIFKKDIKGIYLIERLDVSNEKEEPTFYIGLAVDIFDRWKQHWNNKEQYIDKSIQEFGCVNFSFKILELVTKTDDLKYCETKWINFYKQKYGEKRMFNISETSNTNPHQIDNDTKRVIKKLFEDQIGRSIYAISEKYQISFEDVIKIRKPLLKKHNLKYDSSVKNIVNKTTGNKPENWNGNKITKTLSERIISLKNQNKENREIANECNISITDLEIFLNDYNKDKDNYNFAETVI